MFFLFVAGSHEHSDSDVVPGGTASPSQLPTATSYCITDCNGVLVPGTHCVILYHAFRKPNADSGAERDSESNCIAGCKRLPSCVGFHDGITNLVGDTQRLTEHH